MDFQRPILGGRILHRVTERSSETIELNLHDISIAETDSLAEAEQTGSQIMDMYIARMAVKFKLEVMMLKVCEAVAHLVFTGPYVSRPEGLSVALQGDGPGNGIEGRIDDKLRAERAHPQLGTSEIEVILLLADMVGELISGGHSQTIRLPVGRNEVTGGDFRFFAAVFGIGRYQERFAVSAKNGSVALIKPLGSDADGAGSGLSCCNPPLKHAHAIGGFVFLDAVHGVAVAGAAEMGEASA